MVESASGAPETPERRRVVLHPRTAAARRQDRARSFGGHVRGYTVDTDAVLELVRRQRRMSIRYLAVILVPLVCFALGLSFVPELGRLRPFGLIPLPWLLLGPIALFSIVILAFAHERSALRIEHEWAEEHHVRRSDRATP
ncbi:MAG: hypothetical protein AB8G26_20765 [Ilumatobacter sp.]